MLLRPNDFDEGWAGSLALESPFRPKNRSSKTESVDGDPAGSDQPGGAPSATGRR